MKRARAGVGRTVSVWGTDVVLPDDVRFFQSYPDASGLEMVLDVVVDRQRHTYACNLLGEQTLRLIAPMLGAQRPSVTAAAIARQLYAGVVDQLPEAYVEANQRMYEVAP